MADLQIRQKYMIFSNLSNLDTMFSVLTQCKKLALTGIIFTTEGCCLVWMCRTCLCIQIYCQLLYIFYGLAVLNLQIWQFWQFFHVFLAVMSTYKVRFIQIICQICPLFSGFTQFILENAAKTAKFIYFLFKQLGHGTSVM